MSAGTSLDLFHIDTDLLLKPVTYTARASLADSALSLLTDFRQSAIVSVWIDTPLDKALEFMIQAGVRLCFVTDRDQQLRGLVTAFAIQGEVPMKLMLARGVSRNELFVRDLMEPLLSWQVIEHTQASHASIGQIVATMKRIGQRHLVVVEKDATAHEWRLRGLFAASRIEAALGQPLDIAAIPSTFAEIEAALEHPGM
jgi:CBS-domain-containing membrane protein